MTSALTVVAKRRKGAALDNAPPGEHEGARGATIEVTISTSSGSDHHQSDDNIESQREQSELPRETSELFAPHNNREEEVPTLAEQDDPGRSTIVTILPQNSKETATAFPSVDEWRHLLEKLEGDNNCEAVLRRVCDPRRATTSIVTKSSAEDTATAVPSVQEEEPPATLPQQKEDPASSTIVAILSQKSDDTETAFPSVLQWRNLMGKIEDDLDAQRLATAEEGEIDASTSTALSGVSRRLARGSDSSSSDDSCL